ncbi:hypothetical protein Ciccas_014458 [Cichlidogyrus casuarinus]|uniref:EF-hand domain-containing protein n=1 Tax=Cichlidogyrus casuarinus TaxID=1844966 RepID=A0ABD2PI86_9PLAT
MCNSHIEDKFHCEYPFADNDSVSTGLFSLISTPNDTIDAKRLALLLRQAIQMPRQLGESAHFGENLVEAGVKTCFRPRSNITTNGTDSSEPTLLVSKRLAATVFRQNALETKADEADAINSPLAVETVRINDFINWLRGEPTTIIWMSLLHKLIIASSVVHNVKCSVCFQHPIVGFRCVVNTN